MSSGKYVSFIVLITLLGGVLAGCTGSSGGHDRGGPAHRGAAPGTDFGTGIPASTGSATGIVSDVDAHGPVAIMTGSVLVAGHERPAFRRSTDAGATWTTARIDIASQRSYGSVDDTPVTGAWTRLGWVVAGWASHGYAIWTSRDGSVWQRRPTIPSSSAIAAINARTVDPFADRSWVAVYPTATGVAVLTETYGEDDEDFSFQISGDAEHWTPRRGRVPGFDEPTVQDVAVRGDTIVLVGYGQHHIDDPVLPFIVASTDAGRTWRPASVPSEVETYADGGDLTALPSVTVTPAGFAALSDDSAHPHLLRSADGLHWRLGTAAASLPGRTGRTGDSGEALRYSAGAFRLSSEVDLGSTSTRYRWGVAAFRSTDGLHWSRAAYDIGNWNVQVQGVDWAGDTALIVGTWHPHGSLLSSLWRSAGSALRLQPVRFEAPRDGQPDIQVHGVAGAPGDYAAAGEADGAATFWRSTDGRHWLRAARIGSDGTSGPSAATVVARDRSGWVAAGSVTGSHGRPVPTIWHSVDARHWSAEPDRGAYAQVRFGGTFTALTRGPRGYVALGYANRDNSYERDVFAVVSPDGIHWRTGRPVRIGRPRQLADGTVARPSDFATGGDLSVRSVTPAGSGYVAVGSADQPCLWQSVDGVTWVRRALPTGSSDPIHDEAVSVTARGALLVALGRRTDEPPGTSSVLVWRSVDGGRRWSVTQLPQFGVHAAPGAVAASGPALLASITSGPDGSLGTTLAASRDAVHWRDLHPTVDHLAGPGDQRVTGLTAAGDRVVLLGEDVHPTSGGPFTETLPVTAFGGHR